MRRWIDSIFIFTLQILAISQISPDDDFTLRILSGGKIRGRQVITEQNVSGYQFLGIPYAEPPIANLRYRKPIPIKKWENVIDTTEYKQSCLWNSSETSNDPNRTPMSEDCLFINVLTNRKCLIEGGCAVIFYIHGGGYRYDTPSLFSPQFLIDNFLTEERSVVFVMPAYRLGSFGFLNLSPNFSTSAIKNIAFHDLLEALRWVQKEIKHFGGDANRVTIMGHSSGGDTANLLTMSPMAKNLFSKAIAMSAGGTTPLPFDKNQEASVRLARAARCANNSTNFDDRHQAEAVLRCLRATDAQQLIVLQRGLEDEGYPFEGPCIDGPGGVLPEGIPKLRQKRYPIRLLIGSTAEEFSDTAFLVQPNGKVDTHRLLSVCREAVAEMAFRNTWQTTADCFIEYLNPSRAPHVFDDTSIFLSTALSSEDIHNAGGVSFLYEFQYRFVDGAFNFSRVSLPGERPQHTEDLVYIMGIHKGNFTTKDETIRRMYSEIFVSFVKTGHPSIDGEPSWMPFTPTRNNYFVVDFDENNHMPGMRDRYHERVLKLWNGKALRHSGGILDPVSEKETLHFDVDDDGALANFAAWTDPHSFNRLKGFRVGDVETLQDVLTDAPMDGSTDGVVTAASLIDGGKWNFYFWIAIIIVVVLVILLLITCALLCYNREKRREYERII
uniref:Carboxylic ester hydrolase n=1 Tax=Ascaris suum TaxID=6253 RepID=F1KZR3_ASCSU